ncbi:MAG: nitrite/sulfite reductase, partial [Hydrogenimonas sp.]|nr:nitrite/sulfite reductase [Hydrogenimonas sp.]
DLQFHLIMIKDLPAIFKKLISFGLTTRMAAGDVVRNIVTCPLHGKYLHEIADVSKIAEEIDSLFDENKEFSNLPRKFKIGVSGCGNHCIPHEIQDLSFVAEKFEDGRVLFALYVGGGLASNRRFADFLGYVERDEIVPISKSVVKIFRDFGNREKRNRARLGHLIKEWGVDRFKEILQKISSINIKEGVEPLITSAKERNHCGVIPSDKDGYSHIGCALFGGSFSGEKLLELCNLLDRFAVQEIRTTTKQNFIILDLPDNETRSLCAELQKIKINPYPSAFRTRTTACTGLDFCKFAISETKSVAERVALYLENRFPAFKEPVTISVNGCPNSCAHPCIADIGLSGATFKREGKTLKGFELLVGGKIEGERSSFSKRTGILLESDEIGEFLETVIANYIDSQYETFSKYLSEENLSILHENEAI